MLFIRVNIINPPIETSAIVLSLEFTHKTNNKFSPSLLQLYQTNVIFNRTLKSQQRQNSREKCS